MVATWGRDCMVRVWLDDGSKASFVDAWKMYSAQSIYSCDFQYASGIQKPDDDYDRSKAAASSASSLLVLGAGVADVQSLQQSRTPLDQCCWVWDMSSKVSKQWRTSKPPGSRIRVAL
uniref:Uncharacterized protein n=1 Tax=Lotharella globosa TaxID=91324 RepID=A0A7S3ZCD6_9EUKA